MSEKGNKYPGKKRPVVAVNPDGSVAGYFECIKDAVDKYGMDRHSITDSCRRGTICRGLRWWYEEEFREIYLRGETDKLKYTLDPNRDRLTYHFKKGHKAGNRPSFIGVLLSESQIEELRSYVDDKYYNNILKSRLKPCK